MFLLMCLLNLAAVLTDMPQDRLMAGSLKVLLLGAFMLRVELAASLSASFVDLQTAWEFIVQYSKQQHA